MQENKNTENRPLCWRTVPCVEAGRVGLKYGSIPDTATGNAISEDIRLKAYASGVADAKAEMSKWKESRGGAVYFGKKARLVVNDFSRGLSYQQQSDLNGLAKALGVQIEIVESIKDGQANGEYKDGVIRIAADANSPLLTTVVHETVHRLKEIDLAAYNRLARYVAKNFLLSGDSRRASIAKARQSAYRKAGVEINLSEATEENVADFIANLVENRAEIRKLAEADLTLTQKLFKALKDVFEKVKAFFTNSGADNAEINKRYKALQMFEQEIARVKNKTKDKTNLPDNKSEAKTERKETAGKFEIKKDQYGKEYWHIEDTKDLFKGLSDSEAKNAAFNFILSAAKADTVIKNIDGEQIEFKRLSAQEYVYGPLSKEIDRVDRSSYAGELQLFNKKMRLAPSISDLVNMATIKYHTTDHKAHKLFKNRGFDNYRGRVRIDNVIFTYVVRVGKASFGDVFYDIKLEVDDTVPGSSKSVSDKQSTSDDIRLSQDNQNVKPSAKNSSANNQYMQGKGKYSLKDKITPYMDDAARYEILKDKKINVVSYNKEKLDSKITAEDFEKLKTLRRSDAEKVLKKLGEEFGVFKNYKNTDMELEFSFSRGNLRESMHKQKGKFENYAKMMSVFTEVVENAVGIEAHNERYENDSTITGIYVFISAFADGNEVIPIKLEVKEFWDKKNTLYIAVSLEGIKNGSDFVVHAANLPKASDSYTPSTSTYMVSDILRNVNSIDEDFIKYIPDGFLDNKEQRDAKQRGIERTKDYVVNKNEEKYSTYSLKGVDTLGEYNKLTEQDKAVREKLSVADRNIMDRRAIRGHARRYIKSFGSKLRSDVAEEKLVALYNKMLRGGDGRA